MASYSRMLRRVSGHALFQFHKTSLQLLNRTGTEGQTDGQLNFPDYSDVFVADSFNHRVFIYSKDLKFLSTLGVGQLDQPIDVKVTPDCQVAVLDRSPDVSISILGMDTSSAPVSLGERNWTVCWLIPSSSVSTQLVMSSLVTLAGIPLRYYHKMIS